MWLPPRIVKRVWTVESERERDLPLPAQPEPRRVYTPDVAAALQEAMTHTLTEGTAKTAELDGYTAAGKTGTAEKVVNGRYSNGDNIGSFVCWAPAEPQMRPELLCLVVIDDPSVGKGFGSIVAAPVVQQVLQKALEYLRVPKHPVPEAEKPPVRAATTTRTTPRSVAPATPAANTTSRIRR
jgi:cell division protein FtsI/penicillin-binding protein 2